MKLSGIALQWLPAIIARIIELVDPALLVQTLDSAIHKLETAIVNSENKLDDEIVLPLLNILKLAFLSDMYEKDRD